MRILPVLLLSLVGAPGTATHSPLQAQDAQRRLWAAAQSGDTLAIARALTDGARLDSLDFSASRSGRRALNYAAYHNRPEAVRQLVARGADVNLPNRTGFTPLHHAAETGATDAARALLALGAAPTRKNRDGATPRRIAADKRFGPLAELLAAAERVQAPRR